MKKLALLFLLPIRLIAQDFSVTETKTFRDQADYVRNLRFSPFGNYTVLSLGNNTTELYDRNWNKIFTTQGNPASKGSQCVFTPDERMLIFSKYKNQSDLAVYSMVENRVVQTIQDEGQFINYLTISPDGQYLAFSSFETFSIYKKEDGRFSLQKNFRLEDTKVYSLSFSADNKELIAGLYNKKPKVYVLKDKDWKEEYDIETENLYTEKAIFSPDGKKLAVSHTYSSTIDVYVKKNGRYSVLQTISKLDYTAEVIAFSPDSRYLAAGFANGWIYIWKVSRQDTLEPVRKIYRHDGKVLDLDFSPDGKFMASGGYDKTGVIWSLEGIEPAKRFVISHILGSDITLAQRAVLSDAHAASVMADIDPALLAAKDEFETNMDFLKRREKLRARLTEILQQKLEELYISSRKGDLLETRSLRPVSYDADGGQYFILFMDTPGRVKMPADEAKTFRDKWSEARITIRKTRDKGGENIYREFLLVHPVSGKKYTIIPNENPFVPGSGNVEKARNSQATEKARLTIGDTTGNKASYEGVNYALIFGTNDYDNYNDLVNPLYDARTISDELSRNYGFQTEVVENATLDMVLNKLKRYAQLSYDHNDKLLIFFAGHGKYDEIFREGYLVAKESKLQDDARTTFLSHSNLRTIVNNIDCQHIFLVMDVCFGGTFDPYIAAHRGAEEMYGEVAKSEFIERKMKHRTRLYLTSGGKEYVPDGRPGEHSPFARKFLEALRSYGGKDGILTVSEIISYVEKVVPQPRTGEFGNNEPGSDFVLIAR